MSSTQPIGVIADIFSPDGEFITIPRDLAGEILDGLHMVLASHGETLANCTLGEPEEFGNATAALQRSIALYELLRDTTGDVEVPAAFADLVDAAVRDAVEWRRDNLFDEGKTQPASEMQRQVDLIAALEAFWQALSGDRVAA